VERGRGGAQGEGLRFHELAYVLDAERTEAICSLLRAANDDDACRAIDAWILAYEKEYGITAGTVATGLGWPN
jgi:hypothetical protein